MKKSYDAQWIFGYILLFAGFIFIPIVGSRIVAATSANCDMAPYVIVDAGHGGVDGGAVSCTGIPESRINLEISLKLESLMNLLGIQTIMIRETDTSVYTEGNTIAAQKVSDIRQRVKIANTTPNALLVSIHQNTFPEPQYCGAQIFYNNHDGSKLLAEAIQIAIREHIAPSNNRKSKKATGIYLMEHVNCKAVLIECGFLSNPQEEQKLRDPEYQKILCAVIAASVSQYLNT